MRALKFMLAGAASALVLSGSASAQAPQAPSKDLIQLAQRGPDGPRQGGGGGGGARGGGGGPPPSASPGPRGGGGGPPRAGRGGGDGPRIGRGGDGPRVNRGGRDGPRVQRGGDGPRVYRGGDGPRVRQGDRGGRQAAPPRRKHSFRPGPGFRPDRIRRHGKRYAWGGIPFFFYGGYYYGDCDWLYRRAIATGSPYWWNRYDSCRYWDW